MGDERFRVEHRKDVSRYLLIDQGPDGTGDKVIGEEAYLDVQGAGKPERILYHTLVNEEYSGQGLASFLVRAVVDDLISDGRALVPVCPYVSAWLPKHPEYAEHVVRLTPLHLEELRTRL